MRNLGALCLLALAATAAGQASMSVCGSFSGAPVTCNTGDSVFLKTSLIELGINPYASFGSSSPPPSFYEYPSHCASCNLGFICDYGSDGLGVGSPPYAGDYFVPGTPLEGFAIKYTTADGATHMFKNAGLMGYTGITATMVTLDSDDTQQKSVWHGETDHIRVTITTTVPEGRRLFHTNLCVENKLGGEAISNLYYHRNIDPDQQQPWNGDYSTFNYVKNQPSSFGYTSYINPTYPDLAAVVARGREGVYADMVLALGAFDQRAFATHGGFNNLDSPESWYNSNTLWQGFGGDSTVISDTSRMNYADEAINMVFFEPSLVDSTCFKLYYGLSPDFVEDIVVIASESSSASPSPSATGSETMSATASESATASASASASATASPSPSPASEPAPACLDLDEKANCDTLAHYHLCHEIFPGTDYLVQDVCPRSCKCCVIAGECTCDNDAAVVKCTSKFGYKATCKDLVKHFGCRNKWIGSYLREHCKCSCQRKPSTA